MSQWISVEERLPPEFDAVLVYPRPSDYCCEASHCRGAWKYSEWSSWGDERHFCTVTHWMPPPPPP